MRNNKGFTLMELVAAIFIGGMVTAALVLIWKTASTQTTQGQRQTIIRNQISNFQRQLYKDFYGADVITFPTKTYNAQTSQNTAILAGVKKAKRLNDTQIQILRDLPQGPSRYFVYCVPSGGGLIKRYESTITAPENFIDNLSDYGSALTSTCINNGIDILPDFYLTSAKLEKTSETTEYAGQYSLKGYVKKTFTNVADTTPVYVEIDETLGSHNGGIL